MTRGRVAALIKDARDRHGLSVRDIERAAGISRQSVADYASGNFKQLPTRDRLSALARAIHVPLATLLHAFLVDLDLDVLSMPYGEVWDAISRSAWLTPEQQDVLLRQVEMFRKGDEERRRE